MYKGRFITFEGGEGAGKSTLIDKVFDRLSSRGISVVKTRAPGGTKAGEAVRALLLHEKEHALTKRAELLLFLADRAQHVEELIYPALRSGKVVLCDRFNDSTLAYQGGARDLGEAQVADLCSFASLGLQPDLTLYLDLDPEVGLKRALHASGSKDKIEQEELFFHQKIRGAFLDIARKEPGRFKLMDASLPPEAVFTQAMRLIDALFS